MVLDLGCVLLGMLLDFGRSSAGPLERPSQERPSQERPSRRAALEKGPPRQPPSSGALEMRPARASVEIRAVEKRPPKCARRKGPRQSQSPLEGLVASRPLTRARQGPLYGQRAPLKKGRRKAKERPAQSRHSRRHNSGSAGHVAEKNR
ncbi:hypothetical protein M885DRAFT_280734 [Pelagophyceae sp. CCMP2097]|nr:hypothetical protein M885DRAFT_280734 [Pelagophyceae sp. CCMP2097]